MIMGWQDLIMILAKNKVVTISTLFRLWKYIVYCRTGKLEKLEKWISKK